jgi:hypothetical protein
MLDLPPAIIHVMIFFASVFSRPVFQRLCMLFKAHLLSKGRRTICDLLRGLGLKDEKNFSKFHRIFYGAKWSGLKASRILFQLILQLTPCIFPEIVIAIDSTIERRKGSHIKALGMQRDPVRSTRARKVLTIGLNWLVSSVIVKLPWANKKWALPFLTILMPPKTSLSSSKVKDVKKPLRHKKMTEWTSQIVHTIRYWVGKTKKITIVADSAFACFQVCHACIASQVGFISRLRMDARLHEFPKTTNTKTKGRPRVKGKRLQNPAQMAKDPNTVWKAMTVDWYSGRKQEVLVAALDCIWNAGHKIVPIRMVLVKTSTDAQAEAFFSTDLNHEVKYIIETYIGRWPLEVTFEESRRHLGIETQRQWSDKSIDRETPAIFASFSLINLIALQMISEDEEISIQKTSWYKKSHATFSDVYIHVKEAILRRQFNSCHIKGRQEKNLFDELLTLIAAA